MTHFSYNTEEEVIRAALDIMESKVTYGGVYSTPGLVKQYFQLRLGDRGCEIFSVMFLNSQHQLIHTEDMFRGSVNGAWIYPREIVKAGLRCNAAAIIVSHNHLSGMVEPSDADLMITERLVQALALVDIQVLDHIIVSATKTLSFAEQKLM